MITKPRVVKFIGIGIFHSFWFLYFVPFVVLPNVKGKDSVYYVLAICVSVFVSLVVIFNKKLSTLFKRINN